MIVGVTVAPGRDRATERETIAPPGCGGSDGVEAPQLSPGTRLRSKHTPLLPLYPSAMRRPPALLLPGKAAASSCSHLRAAPLPAPHAYAHPITV